MSDRVYIFDTTLRDGEQSPGCSMTVPEKLRMAAQAGGSGRGHTGSRVPDRLGRRFRSRGCGEPRVPLGAGRRAGALLHAGHGARRRSRCRMPRRPRIHTFIATSDIHLKYKLKKRGSRFSTKPSPLSNWRAAMWTTWSSPPRTPPAPTRIIWRRSRKAVVAAGARTVNLPDTVGFSVPEGIRRADRPDRARRWATRAIVSVHCHDDLGLAVANSIAAVRSGARQIECTINGIGERAGNCSLEEIVMAFKTRSGPLPVPDRHPHRASLSGQPAAVSSIITFGPQPNKAIVGAQRVRARSRHPPGRIPQGTSRPTKSSIRRSSACPKASWCSASTAAGTR